MSNILKRLTTASQEKEETTEVPISFADFRKTTPTIASVNTPVSRTDSGGSVLTPDVKFEGEIEFANNLTIFGSVKGSISANGSLNLEKGSKINANIKAKSMTIKGVFKGQITADEKVQLLADAQIFGDINAARLQVEDGVTFVGQAKITSK